MTPVSTPSRQEQRAKEPLVRLNIFRIRSLTAANVVSVRVTIQSVYGAAPGRLVGVAEVEFYGRS